jgi:hypothetical protein
MSASLDLKQIERRAWRSFHGDGLLDIYLGLMLLAMFAPMTLVMETEVPPLLGFGAAIALAGVAWLILWTGKRLITAPRLGLVKFGPKGRSRRGEIVVLGAVSVLVAMVLLLTVVVLGNSRPEWLDPVMLLSAVYAVWMLIEFSLVARFLHVGRLHLVGALYAIAAPLVFFLHGHMDLGVIDEFIAVGVPAGLILLMGLVVLIRFLRRYPLPESGVCSDTR